MISALASPLVTLAMMGPNMTGMEFLSSVQIPADGSNAGSVDTPTFAGRDMLMILGTWGIPTASTNPALKFNGVGAASYWHRQFNTGDFLGALTFNNVQTPSASSIDLWYQSMTTSGHFLMLVMNRLSTTKTLFFAPSIATGNPSTTPNIVIGAGEWVTTDQQITQISMSSPGALFTPGTGLQVFGRNFP